MSDDRKPNNLKTALILVVIVLAFFAIPFITRLRLG